MAAGLGSSSQNDKVTPGPFQAGIYTLSSPGSVGMGPGTPSQHKYGRKYEPPPILFHSYSLSTAAPHTSIRSNPKIQAKRKIDGNSVAPVFISVVLGDLGRVRTKGFYLQIKPFSLLY